MARQASTSPATPGLMPVVCMECGYRFSATAKALLAGTACRQCQSDDLDTAEGMAEPSSVEASIVRTVQRDNPGVSPQVARSLAREALRRYPGARR